MAGVMPRSIAIVALLASTANSHGGHVAIPEGEAVSRDPIDSILWIHIVLQTLAWGITFPTGMVLGLIKSRWHVPTQVLGIAIALLAYLLGHIHKGRQFAPSAHSGFANLLMLMLVAQVALGVSLRLHLDRGFWGWIRPYQVKAHSLLGSAMPIIAWAQMVFGGTASQGYCRGDHTGQCAAHFIMGSAFVGYGFALAIVLLNGRELLRRTGRSQEFWDSMVISVWGCINTFTEHKWGGTWVANDLDHTSIGIFWWAAGLVGVWLSRDRQSRPRRNLIPAIVIGVTGWAMSGHPQALKVSTMVHAVFGYCLMAAALSRIVEISFLLRDRSCLEDGQISSLQYLTPFLLCASGILLMGATEEQMQMLSDNHVTHIAYVQILFGVSFLLFLFVLMLTHLYSGSFQSAVLPQRDEEHAASNGHAIKPIAVDRQAVDGREFELENLMSDYEDTESAAKQ